jgi:hypothetical protein
VTPASKVRQVGNWLFRNRETGQFTVAQRPNLPLCGFLLGELVLLILPLAPRSRGVVAGVAGGLLAWWAIDEVVRGVNPWRRFLGASVTAFVAGVFVSRLLSAR